MDNEKTDQGNNVVAFELQPRDLRTAKQVRPRSLCTCLRVYIHPDEARLECMDCERLIEPYSFLRKWATERERPLMPMEIAKRDLERELVQLSDMVRKLRGDFKDAAERQDFLKQTAVTISPPRKAKLTVVAPVTGGAA